MDLDIDIELIKAEIEAGHRYAGFYESVTKDSKEAGVADGWLNSYFRDSCPFSEVTFPENDPPDCECHYADGTVVAVEITELVDQRTIKRSEKLERSKKHLEVDDYEWSAEAVEASALRDSAHEGKKAEETRLVLVCPQNSPDSLRRETGNCRSCPDGLRCE